MSTEAAAAGPLLLIVDDDPVVRRLLRTSLAAHGFRILEASGGEDALRTAADYNPDLILLDLGLPDLEGVVVCRLLREWYSGPIVILSARDQEAQKVEALDAGADDYLTKPFGMMELHARIRAALRRSSAPEGEGRIQVFESGPLKVDLAARRVWRNGTEVHLTPIEYQLLLALVHHAGRVVTHTQLLRIVWGRHASSDSKYLRVYMTFLRRKLEPDPLHPTLFRTEAGIGYRLVVADEPA